MLIIPFLDDGLFDLPLLTTHCIEWRILFPLILIFISSPFIHNLLSYVSIFQLLGLVCYIGGLSTRSSHWIYGYIHTCWFRNLVMSMFYSFPSIIWREITRDCFILNINQSCIFRCVSEVLSSPLIKHSSINNPLILQQSRLNHTLTLSRHRLLTP